MSNVEVVVEEEESPPSSPPTPPSPLPISVGPGNSKYYFSSSSSPSPSPPFSAPTSADKLPLLRHLNEPQVLQGDQENPKTRHSQSPPAVAPSVFSLSLDRPAPSPRYVASSSNSSNCLQDLLEWFAIRCCSCCSWTLTPPPRPHQS